MLNVFFISSNDKSFVLTIAKVVVIVGYNVIPSTHNGII